MKQNPNYFIRINGREMTADDILKKQLDAAVLEQIRPEQALDVLWTEEQITEMGRNGLFIQSCLPQDAYILQQAVIRYYVIANDEHRYFIAETPAGTETFVFPESGETTLYKMIAAFSRNPRKDTGSDLK